LLNRDPFRPVRGGKVARILGPEGQFPPFFCPFLEKRKSYVEKWNMPHFPLFFDQNPEQKSAFLLQISTFFALFPKSASETGVSQGFGHFPVCVTPVLELKTGKTQRKKTKSLLKKARFLAFSQKGQKRAFYNNLLSTVLQKRTPPFFPKK